MNQAVQQLSYEIENVPQIDKETFELLKYLHGEQRRKGNRTPFPSEELVLKVMAQKQVFGSVDEVQECIETAIGQGLIKRGKDHGWDNLKPPLLLTYPGNRAIHHNSVVYK